MKLIDACYEVKTDEIPHEVWTAFFEGRVQPQAFGTQVQLGLGDFKSIAAARAAVAWYVDQLGGEVKWHEQKQTKKKT